MSAAAAAPSSPTVSALELRSAAQSRHHLMSPHHPILRVDAVVLREATDHLCSSPAHRRRASRGAELPGCMEGAHERSCAPRGRQRGRAVCSHVRAPQSRCWAFLALWCLMLATEGWFYQPSTLPRPRPLICGRVVTFGTSGSAREAVLRETAKSRQPGSPRAGPGRLGMPIYFNDSKAALLARVQRSMSACLPCPPWRRRSVLLWMGAVQHACGAVCMLAL